MDECLLVVLIKILLPVSAVSTTVYANARIHISFALVLLELAILMLCMRLFSEEMLALQTIYKSHMGRPFDPKLTSLTAVVNAITASVSLYRYNYRQGRIYLGEAIGLGFNISTFQDEFCIKYLSINVHL